jgi:hypothetical protein
MLLLLLGGLVIVALVAVTAWLSRTDDSSSVNGDNHSAALRYGPGAGL